MLSLTTSAESTTSSWSTRFAQRLSARARHELVAPLALDAVLRNIVEGGGRRGERLAALEQWEDDIKAAYMGDARHPIAGALGQMGGRLGIPITWYKSLLTGARLRVMTSPTALGDVGTLAEMVARPLARLCLVAAGERDTRAWPTAEAVCIGLELTRLVEAGPKALGRVPAEIVAVEAASFLALSNEAEALLGSRPAGRALAALAAEVRTSH